VRPDLSSSHTVGMVTECCRSLHPSNWTSLQHLPCWNWSCPDDEQPWNFAPSSQRRRLRRDHCHAGRRRNVGQRERQSSRRRGTILDRVGFMGSQASHQQRAFHQTDSVLFLANDRCLWDYDLIVAHCFSQAQLQLDPGLPPTEGLPPNRFSVISRYW